AAGSVQFEDGGASVGSPVAVNASGQATTTTTFASAGTRDLSAVFTPTVTTAFSGSTGTYSLTVVDANISITPNGTNPVNASHVFTAHVSVNSGSGFVNAPDGTSISFTIDSGPGHFTTPNPCTTSGGTGSCQITLTSTVTG